MEQHKGIEPSPSAWKADILTVIRMLLMVPAAGFEPTSQNISQGNSQLTVRGYIRSSSLFLVTTTIYWQKHGDLCGT